MVEPVAAASLLAGALASLAKDAVLAKNEIEYLSSKLNKFLTHWRRQPALTCLLKRPRLSMSLPLSLPSML